MSRSIDAGGEYRRVIPANLQAVEEFCMGVRRWALSLQLPNRFAVELLAREALMNAAVHGCGCDSSKAVVGVVRLRPGRVIIAVDGGSGFDWRAVRKRLPVVEACSGRGIAIICQYANQLRFNQCGKSLIMIKRFEKRK